MIKRLECYSAPMSRRQFLYTGTVLGLASCSPRGEEYIPPAPPRPEPPQPPPNPGNGNGNGGNQLPPAAEIFKMNIGNRPWDALYAQQARNALDNGAGAVAVFRDQVLYKMLHTGGIVDAGDIADLAKDARGGFVPIKALNDKHLQLTDFTDQTARTLITRELIHHHIF